MNDWFADGATADYCLSAATSVAVKPSRLSHLEAASVPIGVLTAWQGLFERAKPNQKELAEISRLLDSGELQCCVDAVVPFFRASDAYCGTIKEPRGRGRIVLSMIDAI